MRDSRDPFPHMAERSDGRHRALGNGVSHARAPLVKSNRPSRRSAPFASPSRWREGMKGGRGLREEGLSILSPLPFPFLFSVAAAAVQDTPSQIRVRSPSRSLSVDQWGT